MKNALIFSTVSLAIALAGCEKAQEEPTSKEVAKPAASKTPATAKPAAPKKDEPGHEGHDHVAEEKPAVAGGQSGHNSEVIALGTSKLGGFEVRASRDNIKFEPDGDAPIDVWIDGGVGKGVTAVRFWIGSEDAKGSIKAKAEIEDGKWHTHVEIPSPMPAGSKLWVEVEESAGKKTVGAFELEI